MRRFLRLLVVPAAVLVALAGPAVASAGLVSSDGVTVTVNGNSYGDGIVITDVDATRVRVKFAIPGSQSIGVGCGFDPVDPDTQIVCGGTSVSVNAGAGDDYVDLTGLTKPALVHGDAGHDAIYSGSGLWPGANAPREIHGDDGNDYIVGNLHDNTLTGGAGNDTLVGDGGDDTLDGGDGADTLDGGAGTDTLDAGPGADIVHDKDSIPDAGIDCGSGADDATDTDTGDPLVDCEETPQTAGPPTVILDATPSPLSNQTSPILTFSANETGSAFKCKLDGDQGDDSTGFTVCTSPLTMPVSGDGAHTVKVIATDPVGNTSTAVSYTWTLDTTAPSLTLTGPAGPLVAPTEATVQIAGDSDAALTCALNGAAVACGATSTVTLAAAGDYRFSAAATDAAGNRTERTLTLTAGLAPQPPVDPPVAPQPPVTPEPPVTPTDPADGDGDGIRNDWLVNGKPAPAPGRPKVKTVTAKTITVNLPKSPAGGKITVYVRTRNGEFVKAIGKVNSRGELTIKGLKRNTGYEIKVVTVKAGKQSAASKPVKVKTRRK